MTRFTAHLLLLFLVACQPSEETETRPAEINGRWAVEGIYYHGSDITESMSCKLDPSCESPDHGWVEFTPDGRYIRDYGDVSKREAGRWTFKKETRYNVLHLDDDAGDDSDWIISFEGEKMTSERVEKKSFWERPQDSGWPPETSGYKVVYVRQ